MSSRVLVRTWAESLEALEHLLDLGVVGFEQGNRIHGRLLPRIAGLNRLLGMFIG